MHPPLLLTRRGVDRSIRVNHFSPQEVITARWAQAYEERMRSDADRAVITTWLAATHYEDRTLPALSFELPRHPL